MKQIAQFNGSVKDFKEYLKYLLMIDLLKKLQFGEITPEELTKLAAEPCSPAHLN